jgi:nucleoside-diphosphate-sugar epimerase
MVFMAEPIKLFIAGHLGMVGRAVHRLFAADTAYQLITASRDELDLTDQLAVRQFFAIHQPDYLLIAAAKVGGIAANAAQPVEFLLQNLQIAANLLEAAYQHQCQRVLFLGSSCIYPRDCQQPIAEEQLLTGPLERTNDAYAIAKIAGLRLCSAYQQQYGADFRALMPTNLYGPFDNFSPGQSHVLPALLHRFHTQRQTGQPVQIWGSGQPRREFLHVDDLAVACKFVLELPASVYWPAVADCGGFLNVGSGEEVTIQQLAGTIAAVTGFQGEITFDRTKPDGTPRKLLDCSRIGGLGWQASIKLADGIASTYAWYRQQTALRL